MCLEKTLVAWDILHKGLPWWLSGKESTCQRRRCKRCGFNPWVGKNPWRRKLHPTPVFLSEQCQGQRSLCRLHNPWGHKRGWHDLAPEQQTILHKNMCDRKTACTEGLFTRQHFNKSIFEIATWLKQPPLSNILWTFLPNSKTNHKKVSFPIFLWCTVSTLK